MLDGFIRVAGWTGMGAVSGFTLGYSAGMLTSVPVCTNILNEEPAYFREKPSFDENFMLGCAKNFPVGLGIIGGVLGAVAGAVSGVANEILMKYDKHCIEVEFHF